MSELTPYRKSDNIRPIEDYTSTELLEIVEKRKFNNEKESLINYLKTKYENHAFIFKINNGIFYNYYKFYMVEISKSTYREQNSIRHEDITNRISQVFVLKASSKGIKDNKHFRNCLETYKLKFIIENQYFFP